MTENQFINGSIIGFAQVLVGHPFDTLKVNIQNKNYKINTSNVIRSISQPLLMSIFNNSLLFGLFNHFKKLEYNNFYSGMLAGGFTSVLTCPLDYRKVQFQYKENPKLELNKLYKGYQYMLPRESIGNGIYFYTYFKTLEYTENSFISGGLAGLASWTITFPIDTIKTRKQLNHDWSLKQCINYGSLYNGLFFCLCRAFFANGVGFLLYSKLY